MFFTYITQALPWDGAIVVLIVGGVVLGVRCMGYGRISRMMCGVLCFIISSVVFYGSFIEPRIITVSEYEITLPTVEDMTIVVLSDIHVGPYKGKKFVNRIVDRVNSLEPDLVLLVGDYVYHATDPLDRLTPLADIRSTYGMYGVLGNHEYNCYRGNIPKEHYSTFNSSERVFRALERVGVRMLMNSWEEIEVVEGTEVRNHSLYVGGVDDQCSGHDDLGKALPKITQKSSVILLAHDPSIILDKRVTYAHLIASGHTHGGQVRLPFIGAPLGVPTQLPRKFDQGLFSIDNNTTLAISRGLGEAAVRARLFAPPQILVLRVNPAI